MDENNPNAGQRNPLRKGNAYQQLENVPFYFVKDLEANSDLIENNIVNEKTVKLHNRSLIISVML